jgi:23S rRNA (uracil1939-C5)-methyltransferase
LSAYDTVVLDPPRAGARAQSEALAGSKVQKIAMVSCNPATCARDARILIDGGYRLTRIVPVDQFLFSPHIELVAWLER